MPGIVVQGHRVGSPTFTRKPNEFVHEGGKAAAFEWPPRIFAEEPAEYVPPRDTVLCHASPSLASKPTGHFLGDESGPVTMRAGLQLAVESDEWELGQIDRAEEYLTTLRTCALFRAANHLFSWNLNMLTFFLIVLYTIFTCFPITPHMHTYMYVYMYIKKIYVKKYMYKIIKITYIFI